MSRLPPPPPGSGPAGKRLWRSVLADYELSGADLEVLKHAVAVADDIASLEPVLKLGPFIKGADGQPRANPALVQRRQLVLVMTRLLAAIRVVGDVGSDEHDRGQRRVGLKGVYAGNAHTPNLKAVK